MELSNFQQKISSADKPLVVDFWADWCGPCKMTQPILDALADDYAGKVEFLPVDADKSRELLAHYKVYGIPTVLAFANGEEVARVTGVKNKGFYQNVFESLAEGKEIQSAVTVFDRFFRLGSGTVLGLVGLSAENWMLVSIGALIAFWGIYDRCPIWAAITGMFGRSR